MIDIPELLPCPFCGGVNMRKWTRYIECLGCNATSPNSYDGDEWGAIKAWNTRHDATQPDEPTHDPDFTYPRPEPLDLGGDG